MQNSAARNSAVHSAEKSAVNSDMELNVFVMDQIEAKKNNLVDEVPDVDLPRAKAPVIQDRSLDEIELIQMQQQNSVEELD